MVVFRCACGAVATHAVEITRMAADAKVPVPRAPGDPGTTMQGFYNAAHIPTLKKIEREMAAIGWRVTTYEIKELIEL